MAYILWRFVGSDPSLGFEPYNFECFVGEEAEIAYEHSKLD